MLSCRFSQTLAVLFFVIPLYLDAFVTIVGALCRGLMSLCKKNKAPKAKVRPGGRQGGQARAAGLVVSPGAVHRGRLAGFACLRKIPVVRGGACSLQL